MITTQYDAFTAAALEICQSIDDAHRGMTRGKADLLIAIRRFEELELAREVGARSTSTSAWRTGWLSFLTSSTILPRATSTTTRWCASC